MPSEVHASVNLGLSKGQHRTVFRNPRGNKRYYAFYIDATLNLRYEWSSDGTSWTNTPGGVYAGCLSFDVKIRDSGSDLDVFLVANISGGDVVAYDRGNISDTSDTITWETGRNIKTGVGYALSGDPCVAIARTDNGRLVVAFTEDIHDKCKDYRQTKLIGSDGDGASPTWSGETTWDDPSTNGNNQNKDQVWFGLENFGSGVLSGNGIAILARTPSALGVTEYVVETDEITWNGTAFANLSSIGQTGGDVDDGKCLSLLIDESDYLHIIYYDGISNSLESRKATSAGSDTMGSEITVKSADVDACTLTLDTGANELYAFYHNQAGAVEKENPTTTEQNDWSLSGGSSAHECVDDGYSHDSDTTYIYTSNRWDTVRLGGFSGGNEDYIYVVAKTVSGVGAIGITTYKNGGLVEGLGFVTPVATGYLLLYKKPTISDWNEIRLEHNVAGEVSIRITAVFYGTKSILYKKTAIAPISWGTENYIGYFGDNLVALTSWNRDVESSLHIGLEDADTDVWYHELTVAVAATSLIFDSRPVRINTNLRR